MKKSTGYKKQIFTEKLHKEIFYFLKDLTWKKNLKLIWENVW